MPRRSRCVATLACLGIAACGGNPLIRPDDQTFTRAQTRLLHTQTLVDTASASKAESVAFMQAEGLYQYRFEPAARSFGSYFMQALAVATEFAPLQALAASAGMFELRLRGYDGAVQLWESLLLRSPLCTLAPLTLYRLGWAYRSLNTSGFPREEPQEAFDELIRRFPLSPLSKLAIDAKSVPWKSQDMAIGLSIVPGAGQAYAGEWGNGSLRFLTAAVFAAVAIVPIVVIYKNSQQDRLWTRQNAAWAGTSILGIILLNVAYVAAYQDAQRAVVQFNERGERAFEDRHPEAP